MQAQLRPPRSVFGFRLVLLLSAISLVAGLSADGLAQSHERRPARGCLERCVPGSPCEAVAGRGISSCLSEDCSDGVDNDGDGLVDCQDDECDGVRDCSAGLPGFRDMTSITWDSHVHSGNSAIFACLTDPGFDAAVGCHSHRWCDDVYREAKARGLEAIVLAHHANQLESPAGLAAWVANPGGYVDAYGAVWPTHADGYPLLVSGGHTTDEVDALWECAEANTVDGEFLAFYGVEYSTGAPTSPGCDVPGAPNCGGHKIGIFGSRPEISCTHFPPGPEACLDEGEFYAALDRYSDPWMPSIGGAAHPLLSWILADFEPYSDSGARGGMSRDHVFGYELRREASEDVPCEDHSDPPVGPPTARCGYRQVLAHGWRVAPWRGSDNHLNPGLQWDLWIHGVQKGVCLANSFTKQGFLNALEQRRCYWALRGEPMMQFELEGVPMGQSVAPSGALDYAVYIDGRGVDVGGGWEIGCGEVTRDGSNGNYAVRASGPCVDGICQAAGSFPAEGNVGWCYLRFKNGNGNMMGITAPVVLKTAPRAPQRSTPRFLGPKPARRGLP